MAAYFIDLDGVFFKYGTMEPNDGALQFVEALWREGHQVFFITKRRRQSDDPSKLTAQATKNVLAGLNVHYSAIIPAVSSPRVLISDDGAFAIEHITDTPLHLTPPLDSSQLLALESLVNHSGSRPQDASRVLAKRIFDVLAAIAWASWRYPVAYDADDYLQTILVAQSLIQNDGFNHQDIVRRFRARPNIFLKGQPLMHGGTSPAYRGQIKKLLRSTEPLYLSPDGVSDGCAMRVAPIAAFYLDDVERLVRCTDQIARITHKSVEARLAAVLVALRYHQLLSPNTGEAITDLLNDLRRAIHLLGHGADAGFFMGRVECATNLANSINDPDELLFQLGSQVGLSHLAWATPISACFWSFRGSNDFEYWFRRSFFNQYFISFLRVDDRLEGKIITAQTLDADVHRADMEHLKKIGEYDSFIDAHSHHWGKSMDVDTFWSIAFGMIAARDGIAEIISDVRKIVHEFAQDLPDISAGLATRAKPAAPAAQQPVADMRYQLAHPFEQYWIVLDPAAPAGTFLQQLRTRGTLDTLMESMSKVVRASNLPHGHSADGLSRLQRDEFLALSRTFEQSMELMQQMAMRA